MASKREKAAERAERAAQLRREQQAAERRRTLLAVGGGVLAVLVLLGGTLAYTLSQDSTSDIVAESAGESAYGVTIGPDDAPHEIVIYEDFLCPFCGQLEAATRDDLAELAEAGNVQVEYRPYELLSGIGDYSRRATNAFAVVLEAEGPEVAKVFHDLLFEEQPSESGPFPSDEDLIDLAVEAGADEDAVTDGIVGLSQADWVDGATQAARDAGIQGTPTVLLDGEVLQPASVDDLADQMISGVE